MPAPLADAAAGAMFILLPRRADLFDTPGRYAAAMCQAVRARHMKRMLMRRCRQLPDADMQKLAFLLMRAPVYAAARYAERELIVRQFRCRDALPMRRCRRRAALFDYALFARCRHARRVAAACRMMMILRHFALLCAMRRKDARARC